MKVLKKCNHPDCIDGVMHEKNSLGITNIYKCNYCQHAAQEEDWRKSETAIKLKTFIDKQKKLEGCR